MARGEAKKAKAERELQHRLEQVHRLRGEYISAVAHVEDWLDLGIMDYFEMERHPKKVRFQTWLLGMVSLGSKLELLRRVVREMRMYVELKPVFKALDDMKATRDAIAHSRVTLELPDSTEQYDQTTDLAPYVVIGNRPGGRTVDVPDAEAMTAELAKVTILLHYAIGLNHVIYSHREGRDTKAALAGFYERQGLTRVPFAAG